MGAKKFDTKEALVSKIPVGEMVVDPEYQGHVNKGLVDRIAKRWDDAAAGAVVLNWREDNTYAVLDGQHRVLAAQRAGVTDLNALVFVGKTKKEEATLFVQLNTKHNVLSIDRFRANLAGGGVSEKNIVQALREVGLDIGLNGPRPDGTKIQCVNTLSSIYTNHGLAHFKIVAGILTSAFHGYPDRYKAYAGNMWEAVSQFVYRYPEADISRLIQKLKEKSPTVIGGMADAATGPGQSAWMGFGKVITGLYNVGYRTTYGGYLPPERWLKKFYTPAGKEAIKKSPSRRAAAQRAHSAMMAKSRERKAAKVGSR